MYKVKLCALDERLYEEWEKEFKDCDVKVIFGNILNQEADAIVSPGNSFGFMDGGLDYQLSEFFGWDLEKKLQENIRKKHEGELLVGMAEILGTGNKKIPYIVCAPTMRVPMVIPASANPYLATRGVFLSINNFNNRENDKIKSVLVPGMGTGIGKVPYDICARQMRIAYEDVILGKFSFPKSYEEAQKLHVNLFKKSIKD